MIIDCLADCHGFYPQLEGGDLLIVAGDLTARDLGLEHHKFVEWLSTQPYKRKVFCAGNHDNYWKIRSLWWNDLTIEYLCDSGTEFKYEEKDPIDKGAVVLDTIWTSAKKLKIWGSPWTPWFKGINPLCTAFTGTEEELEAKFALIPDDTDILVTHGPPHGCYLDENREGKMLGSVALRDRCFKLKLKLHVFGHIHEGYGRHSENVNCSHVNEHYQQVNKPVRIVL
jgi:Icc-related predicted phosphoesterase